MQFKGLTPIEMNCAHLLGAGFNEIVPETEQILLAALTVTQDDLDADATMLHCNSTAKTFSGIFVVLLSSQFAVFASTLYVKDVPDLMVRETISGHASRIPEMSCSSSF